MYRRNTIGGGEKITGAKLANIYSTEFMVETNDPKKKKTYRQVVPFFFISTCIERIRHVVNVCVGMEK